MGWDRARRAGLAVVRGGAEQVEPGEDGEAMVLAIAVEDIDRWITDLPASSDWRWTFARQREALLGELAARRSQHRTAHEG